MRLFILFTVTMAFYLLNSDRQDNSFSFLGNQDQAPLFTFGVFADAQYCDCEPSGTRFYRNSYMKMEEALNLFKEVKPDFIINLGDLIEKDFSSFAPLMKMIEKSGLKVYHVPGNHDFSVEQKYKKRVLPLLCGKNGYYSFVHNSFRFIVLNGNEISTYGPGTKSQVKEAEEYIERLKAEGEPNFHDWNGGTGKGQTAWLKSELDASAAAGEKVFILCHFPVWPENEHNMFNYREIIEILKNYSNIIAWFSGHNHTGNYGNTHMIHFVNFKGMVETENQNSFAIIEVYGNKIWIKGYGRERSMILAY